MTIAYPKGRGFVIAWGFYTLVLKDTEISEQEDAADGLTEDEKFYLEELMSNECQCGNGKKPRFSFCYRCYLQLPQTMKNSLYDHVGEGYEESYDAAVEYLNT